jgi:hypothetical protein
LIRWNFRLPQTYWYYTAGGELSLYKYTRWTLREISKKEDGPYVPLSRRLFFQLSLFFLVFCCDNSFDRLQVATQRPLNPPAADYHYSLIAMDSDLNLCRFKVATDCLEVANCFCSKKKDKGKFSFIIPECGPNSLLKLIFVMKAELLMVKLTDYPVMLHP